MLLWSWCPLWLPSKSFWLFSSIESIRKSRILFETIIRDSVGESSYIKTIVYADERQSLENQFFPVTGNTEAFFSIRKAKCICLPEVEATLLSLRNWVQGTIWTPKTNPASLISRYFHLSSTFNKYQLHWSFSVSKLPKQEYQDCPE